VGYYGAERDAAIHARSAGTSQAADGDDRRACPFENDGNGVLLNTLPVAPRPSELCEGSLELAQH